MVDVPVAMLVLGVLGACATVGGMLIGVGMTLQRLSNLKDGFEELRGELRNGITRQLSEHSGEIDVLKTEIIAVKDTVRHEVQSIKETCAIRHLAGARAGK